MVYMRTYPLERTEECNFLVSLRLGFQSLASCTSIDKECFDIFTKRPYMAAAKTLESF